jgi:hypothetical protein
MRRTIRLFESLTSNRLSLLVRREHEVDGVLDAVARERIQGLAHLFGSAEAEGVREAAVGMRCGPEMAKVEYVLHSAQQCVI